MFAAQAAAECGRDVVILSIPNKSPIYGAQFLHRPIRGITEMEPVSFVKVIKLGSAREYAKKIYGDPTAHTSWTDYDDDHMLPAWDLRAAYDAAWKKWSPWIIPTTLTPNGIDEIVNDFGVVISTIPLSAICQQPYAHRFVTIPVHYFDSELAVHKGKNVITYNGLASTPWHRASRIFGHGGVERRFPSGPPSDLWKPIPKIVGNTCDCHPLLHRAGRLGRFERGVLTHNAYTDTIKAIKGDE